MLLKAASPCRRALRLARAPPAPVRGPRLRRPLTRLAALLFVEVIARHRRGRRAGRLTLGFAELAIDNVIGHLAQMVTEALAVEVKLPEHVLAPGHRATIQAIDPFIVADAGFERRSVF